MKRKILTMPVDKFVRISVDLARKPDELSGFAL